MTDFQNQFLALIKASIEKNGTFVLIISSIEEMNPDIKPSLIKKEINDLVKEGLIIKSNIRIFTNNRYYTKVFIRLNKDIIYE